MAPRNVAADKRGRSYARSNRGIQQLSPGLSASFIGGVEIGVNLNTIGNWLSAARIGYAGSAGIPTPAL